MSLRFPWRSREKKWPKDRTGCQTHRERVRGPAESRTVRPDSNYTMTPVGCRTTGETQVVPGRVHTLCGNEGSTRFGRYFGDFAVPRLGSCAWLRSKRWTVLRELHVCFSFQMVPFPLLVRLLRFLRTNPRRLSLFLEIIHSEGNFYWSTQNFSVKVYSSGSLKTRPCLLTFVLKK